MGFPKVRAFRQQGDVQNSEVSYRGLLETALISFGCMVLRAALCLTYKSSGVKSSQQIQLLEYHWSEKELYLLTALDSA